MKKRKLSDFTNEKGSNYFASVARTNHFVKFEVSAFADREEITKDIKRVDEVLFIKFENNYLWVRIRSSLNRFIKNLDGSVQILEFDKFDKQLWLWYIENETPLRFWWMIWLFSWFW